jgi:hypothetical protein
MLAKLTAENQLTLPKSIAQAIGAAEYFEVILTPVKIQGADSVRAKLGALNVNEQDITDAVEWARQ